MVREANRLLVLTCCSLATAAYSYVPTPRLERLADQSDLVVIGRVTEVERVRGADRHESRTLVRVDVEEVLKGAQIEQVTYVITYDFICDVSRGELGERVLLFLHRVEENLYRIAVAGRGRFLIVEEAGVILAVPWRVIWPAELSATVTVEVERRTAEGVALEALLVWLRHRIGRVD